MQPLWRRRPRGSCSQTAACSARPVRERLRHSPPRHPILGFACLIPGRGVVGPTPERADLAIGSSSLSRPRHRSHPPHGTSRHFGRSRRNAPDRRSLTAAPPTPTVTRSAAARPTLRFVEFRLLSELLDGQRPIGDPLSTSRPSCGEASDLSLRPIPRARACRGVGVRAAAARPRPSRSRRCGTART